MKKITRLNVVATSYPILQVDLVVVGAFVSLLNIVCSLATPPSNTPITHHPSSILGIIRLVLSLLALALKKSSDTSQLLKMAEPSVVTQPAWPLPSCCRISS